MHDNKFHCGLVRDPAVVGSNTIDNACGQIGLRDLFVMKVIVAPIVRQFDHLEVSAHGVGCARLGPITCYAGGVRGFNKRVEAVVRGLWKAGHEGVRQTQGSTERMKEHAGAFEWVKECVKTDIDSR